LSIPYIDALAYIILCLDTTALLDSSSKISTTTDLDTQNESKAKQN